MSTFFTWSRALAALACGACAACGGTPAPASSCVESSLQGRVDYTVGGAPNAIASADLDGDGLPDLAVAGGGFGLALLFNTGQGTFGARVDAPSDMPNTPRSIAANDLNGDGYPDLVIADGAAARVLFNQGDGSFDSGTPLETGVRATFVATVDLDGDGLVDVAAGSQNDSTVSVVLNKGGGTFAKPIEYTVQWPSWIAPSDLNGDGKPDLVVVNGDRDTVSVLLNMGGGAFAPPVLLRTNDGGVAAVVADLNRDGRPDIVVASNVFPATASVLINRGDGKFAGKVDYPVAGMKGLAAVDMNGDGALDLVFAADTLTVLINAGDGTFSKGPDVAVGKDPTGILATDLSGDGKPDLAVANQESSSVSVLLAECAR